MMAERGVRPTLLQPFWHVAGYGLGAVTALMGPQRGHGLHRGDRDRDRPPLWRAARARSATSDPELAATIEEFRAEEVEHRDTAIAAGAEDAFGYPILSGLIRAGCRVAIALSKRI